MLSRPLGTSLTAALAAVSFMAENASEARASEQFAQHIAMIRRNGQLEAQLIGELLDGTPPQQPQNACENLGRTQVAKRRLEVDTPRPVSESMSDDALLPSLRTDSLPNFRKRRYLGDDLCLPLSAFTAADGERVRELYDFLQDAFAVFSPAPGSASAELERAEEFIREQDLSARLRSVRQFGISYHDASELMAKTIHDVRGGGLSFLLNHLQFAQMGDELSGESLRTFFFLTRDHLKIMRNALLGLDDAKRAEDLLPKLHGISFIVEKWTNALLHDAQRQVRLEVDSRFDGNISECCVEFGALDRILYNLINNASRHTATDRVRLTIVPLPATHPLDLRFIVANEVSETEAANLGSRDPTELFRPGVSSTGSGFGMTVAADFVANAYGLGSRDEAVAGQYVGAQLVDRRFVAWFHWPIAPDI